jgi:hypothetical protein
MSKRSKSKRGKVYKYVSNIDCCLQTNLLNREFNDEWLSVSNTGEICCKGTHGEGYAWDGCSPKFNFLHFIWGTPDGKLDYNTEKPYTYYASMIHDVIYQYKDKIDISRKEADIIFKEILHDAGFLWWWVYYIGVRIGGGFYGKWKRKKRKTQKKISINNPSWLLN